MPFAISELALYVMLLLVFATLTSCMPFSCCTHFRSPFILFVTGNNIPLPQTANRDHDPTYR